MNAPRFIPGLHQPADVQKSPKLQTAFLSINRIRGRQKPIPGVHIIDSGAFRELEEFGAYRHEPAEYAAELRRLHEAGIVRIEVAVAQDYMCEPFMLAKTGLTVAEHQRLTIERYDALLAERLPFPIMPVLQGYDPAEYVAHLRAYGDRLTRGMWVGVGSVCKRNGNPTAILAVLGAIKAERPDLRLHGFGLKTTSLLDPRIRELLYSADSMAWSFAARRQGRNANDWREAVAFVDRITSVIGGPFRPYQLPLFSEAA